MRLLQIDTYKCANGDFKEVLEGKLHELAVHPEWWTTVTEEWEGAYTDYGPPIHTWLLTDKTEEEVLAVARTVCPYADIGYSHEPIACKSDLKGLLCAVRPERYKDILLTEEELQSRLCIDDWGYYFSYGPKGWFPWQVERMRAIKQGKTWKPNFPTEIKFNQEKLRQLYEKAEKLRYVWNWKMEVPSKTNLLAMIGVPELVQVAKFECGIEFPEGEADVDGEFLLDAILSKLPQEESAY